MTKYRLNIALALGCVALFNSSALAQANIFWNSTGTDWATAPNWNPNFVPTAADTAVFLPSGASTSTAVQNPDIAGSQSALSLTVGPNQLLGGWTFNGAGTLNLGGTGSTGLTTYGPATYTFNGPALSGASATSTLNLNATNGSTLVLGGNSTALTNLSALTAGGSAAGVNVLNGRFVLDNSITNVTNRLATTGTIKQQGGGTFELIGNAAGGTYNVGLYNVTDNSVGGVNTIRVTSNSTTANTVLNFANTGAFSLRQGTRNVTVFSSNGELGSANGPRITFDGTNGTPTLTAGVFANSPSTPGFVIVSDSTGVNFGTYSTARGVQSVGSTTQTTATVTTATTAAQLQAFTAAGASGTIGQFNIAAGTTETATANIPGNTLRITPGGSGSTLAMGTFNLLPAAIMLDGPNDFSITGTGTLFVGTHYIYVNNPNAILNLQPTLTTAGNAVAFAGPGFLNLTGTVNQNLATTQRIGVLGGVLRANNTQLGFSSSSQGILNLTGGILEIAGGTNGTGASADFTRPLGQASSATSGVVNFNSATAEQGSGGFSAFGSNASVNIGGNASPTPLQWGQPNFVGNGYALKFGSTKSNAVLTFQNPLQLDNGTAPYQPREINVTAGVGGDRTVLSGVISGTAPADLIKTGTGTLALTATNTYAGNTYVSGGTLLANNATSSTGTGAVRVAAGATLGGTGTVAPTTGNTVAVLAGGTIRGGDGTGSGTLTLTNGLTLAPNANVGVRVAAAGTGAVAANTGVSSAGTFPNTTNHSYINVTGGTLTADQTQLNLVIDGTGAGFTEGQLYSYQIGRVSGQNLTGFSITDQARFTAVGFTSSNFSVGGNEAGFLYLNFTPTPVPEPATVLAFAAGALGLGGYVRRRVRG